MLDEAGAEHNVNGFATQGYAERIRHKLAMPPIRNMGRPDQIQADDRSALFEHLQGITANAAAQIKQNSSFDIDAESSEIAQQQCTLP